jgi:hypothetical protein
MALVSTISTVVMTAGTALAIELRRISEVQVVVAEQRSADASARNAARGCNAS